MGTRTEASNVWVIVHVTNRIKPDQLWTTLTSTRPAQTWTLSYIIWRFPEIGVPPVLILILIGFSMFHKPSSDILGYPHDLGPPHVVFIENRINQRVASAVDIKSRNGRFFPHFRSGRTGKKSEKCYQLGHWATVAITQATFCPQRMCHFCDHFYPLVTFLGHLRLIILRPSCYGLHHKCIRKTKPG